MRWTIRDHIHMYHIYALTCSKFRADVRVIGEVSVGVLCKKDGKRGDESSLNIRSAIVTAQSQCHGHCWIKVLEQ